MYSNDYLESNSNYFVTNSTNKIEVILPQCEYSINFKFDGVLTKKNCFIAAEKIDLKELIQIRISEEDHRKMFISTINVEYFNILKVNQSLHVTFQGFVENLLKFFKECHKGNLQMILTRNRDEQLALQFYEAHSFKNLIHLNLPIEEAPLHIINFHLHKIVDKLQKQNQAYANSMQDMKNDLNHAYNEISQLKNNNSKFREDISEQKQAFLRRQKEELDEMQAKMKKLTELKELDEVKFEKSIVHLQSRIEILTLEKSNALKEKGNEVKKNEAGRKEIINLKSIISNLRQKNDQLSTEMSRFQNKDQQLKTDFNNLNKKSNEMNDKLKKFQKHKSELEAELEAEKQICQTKRNALAMATEEISKANQIISKQSMELSQLKKTIDWRTEVALQQEIAIKSKEAIVDDQKRQILNFEQELKNIRTESRTFPLQVKSIKDMVDEVEKKYNKRITEIKKNIPI